MEVPRGVVAQAPRPAPVQPAPPPVNVPARSSAPVSPPPAARVPPWEDEPDVPSAPAEPASPALKIEATPVSLAPPPQVFEPKEPAAPVIPVQVAVNHIATPARAPAQARAVAATGAPAAEALQPTEEGEFWYRTVQQLIAEEAITALVRVLALQSQLVARDTGQWSLRVAHESLIQASSCDRLAAALQVAGHAVRLVVEVGVVTDSPARRNAALAVERQQAAEKIIEEDPFVQAMMRDFGAKIVPGSIKPV